MSGTTVVSVGNTSVSTTGAYTGQLLNRFANALSVSAAVSSPGASPPPSNGQYNQTLIIPSSITGTINVPTGYEFVIYLGSGNLVGTDPREVIIGDLNYTGTSGTVIGTGTGNGTVVDSTGGATFSMSTGNEMITALGAADMYMFDSGYSTVIGGSGSDSVSVGGSASVVGFFGSGEKFSLTTGSATMVAGANSAATLGSGNNEFVDGGAGNGTVIGGSGHDTIFALGSTTGGIMYEGGTGNSVFIGGAGLSTVYTAQSELAFSGAGGDIFNMSSNSSTTLVATAGNSTVTGGSSHETVYSTGNDSVTDSNSVAGGTYYLFGSGASVNMAGSAGGKLLVTSDFLASGNTDITMSGAGNDSLVLYSPNEFNLSHGTATLTLSNWQGSDVLDLTYAPSAPGATGGAGYQASDAASAQAQLAAGSSFTLSDGTTVVFQGAKPTTIYHV